MWDLKINLTQAFWIFLKILRKSRVCSEIITYQWFSPWIFSSTKIVYLNLYNIFKIFNRFPPTYLNFDLLQQTGANFIVVLSCCFLIYYLVQWQNSSLYFKQKTKFIRLMHSHTNTICARLIKFTYILYTNVSCMCSFRGRNFITSVY